MPAPVLSQEQWGEVEKGYILGLSATELGRQFDVDPNTIHQRAWEKDWLSPRKLQKMKEEHLQSKADNQEGLSESKEGPKAGEIVAESLAEMGQTGALLVAKGLLPLIKRTFQAESALLREEITSWKDASSAFGMFAKASGLDKPQQAVQINLWQQSDDRE